MATSRLPGSPDGSFDVTGGCRAVRSNFVTCCAKAIEPVWANVMAVVDLNLNPSPKQLRQFGLIGLVVLPLFGWLFAGKPLPGAFEPRQLQIHGWFIAAGVALGGFALIRPTLLKWLFVAACVVTFPIGLVLGEVIMATIYMLVFLPVGLFFRITGRDALERDIQKQRDSYWQPKKQPKNAASYFRQS